MFEDKRVLTGVKPTGRLHIANYFGAIRPAIELGKEALANNGKHIMFIADYHAINAEKDPNILNMAVKEIACAYLAAGLDPSKSVFYRQSDVPEIFEIATIISAFTPKGLMNKSHAYKAQVDKNLEAGKPNDDGINMGLYTYPTLMASDILTFDTDIVPVGKDQIQHVEIARDIAGAINALYNKEVLVRPDYVTKDRVAVVPGTDGRKMSKSYGNVIPLYADDATTKKAVYSTVTDSKGIDEPKNPEDVVVYQIFKAFAADNKIAEMKEGLEKGGLGYGHIKKMLLDELIAQTKDEREKFEYYMNHFDEVKIALDEGAQKARAMAQKTLHRLKETVFGTF